jgi:hypothetical protein
MTRSDFIKQVYKGVYLYVQDKNKIVKVTRVFPDFQPAYAEYDTANGPDAAFYTKVQIVPKETLAKILNRKKNAETNVE